MCHVSRVTCQVSHVTCDVTRVTCDVTRVTCDMSRVMGHNFYFQFYYNVAELVGEGSVINGAYLFWFLEFFLLKMQ